MSLKTFALAFSSLRVSRFEKASWISFVLQQSYSFLAAIPQENYTSHGHENYYMFTFIPERTKSTRNLVTFAKHNKRKKPWWRKVFSDQEEPDQDEFLDESLIESEEDISEEEKFEAWRRKAEAIVELREAQENARNEEGRAWEDWVQSEGQHSNFSDWDWRDGGDKGNGEEEDISAEPKEIIREKGIFEDIKATISGRDEDLLFEDRVFKYASSNSAKFIAVLILVPWLADFVVHDFVLMRFLDRYVKKVPLAAELLDVRRSQKLEMVKELKLERARFRFEVEIGKAPPLSEEEIWGELRQKVLEMTEERRLENRKAFANVWSDMVYGIVLFLLIYFNESKVALLKFTGYKLLNNVSDIGKAFFIILVTDIILGYHSESGWEALVEVLLERYGIEVDKAAIYIFIGVVPVIVDAFVKLWLFKYLPRLSPNVSNIIKEVKRH
ncbi:cemA-like proton extrusion protein-like protein [Carex rostrata]